MLQIERLKRIEEIVEQNGTVSIALLEDELRASKATVYRDVKSLQKDGVIRFVHGGISRAQDGRQRELPYHEKRASNTAEKRRIAREAAEAIRRGSTVFLDSSTTVAEIIPFINQEDDLKIVTNDIMIGTELALIPGIEAHVIGGMIRKGYYTLTGPFAQQCIRDIRIDTAFFGSDAISLEAGCMLTNLEEVPIKQQVMAAASECILLADHTKFSSSAFVSFAEAQAMDQIIAGTELPDEIFSQYISADANIIRV